MRVEVRAIEKAEQYFAAEGYAVTNVSRVRGHNGYDLLVEREGQSLRIEVKGCSRIWQIPDLFATEFDSGRRLIADVLCVVYFTLGYENTICLIPRDAIPADMVVEKRGYRIRSKFKKESVLKPYAKIFGGKVDGG
jgi:hypothetical protein